MARTNFPKAERTIPEDIHYAIRCIFPCPCGGSTPDAPSWCEHKEWTPRAACWCAPLICCSNCEYKLKCPAYKKCKQLLIKRRIDDMAKAPKNV